ncbi:Bifunctional inhibitor/plant lipid transfer protein/seed storage helical domain containing protein [Parasponia andersonii]|uniref:Bifunctional inhibitor/plant lipid transfer protein/seed storage helical domain containing protein n=1 Tax=Parasponia andersonii TaxID=3476 RepID=A0A2P5CFX1_PARAD|nr:Bifunctional inhibitor/plant lipid transfer protein/seed storage helical domain containing protein [Parasponia andersonii]
MKLIYFVGLLVVIASAFGIERAYGATNACGKSTLDNEAMKLAPCAVAAKDENAAVSDSCCQQVKKIGQNPSCLCAVLLLILPRALGSSLRSPLLSPNAATLQIVQWGTNVDVSILFIFRTIL